MKTRWTALSCLFAVALAPAATGASAVDVCALQLHAGTDHDDPGDHTHVCGFQPISDIVVSEGAGLGQSEIRGRVGAVLQRDEGIVALLDVSDLGRPKVVGRYDDDARDSLDGDLAFSDDGNWLFYARQTEQFSKDGIHVLDVSDPSAPRLTTYQPQGGTFRIAYYATESAEWVISLDAIHGLVVNRFERTTGQLVPVHVDPLPATKVGGPASAGIAVVPKDRMSGKPLLYVTTGRTGLQVFDFSDPANPRQLGAWDAQGLADIAVAATKKRRTVYAATEYWFRSSEPPAVVVLDASKPEAIKAKARWQLGVPAEPLWMVQGMAVSGRWLYVAHSHAGLLGFDTRGVLRAAIQSGGSRHEGARVTAAPYYMDVEVTKNRVVTTDAATGELQVLRHQP